MLKSIHDISIGDEDKTIFTEDVLSFIVKEGFEKKSNDSYNKELEGSSVYWSRGGNSGSNILGIYIGLNGIAIDSDYDCGGNSSTYFFKFDTQNDSGQNIFENAYNDMVKELNRLRSY